MNPLIQGKSGTTPVMSRNAFSTNQGTNEDDSQSDPHPEAGIFGNQTMRKSGQKDRRDSSKNAIQNIGFYSIFIALFHLKKEQKTEKVSRTDRISLNHSLKSLLSSQKTSYNGKKDAHSLWKMQLKT